MKTQIQAHIAVRRMAISVVTLHVADNIVEAFRQPLQIDLHD